MISEWKTIDSAPKAGKGAGMFSHETKGREILATDGSSHYIVFWNGHSWDDGDFHAHVEGLTHWDDLPPLPEKV